MKQEIYRQLNDQVEPDPILLQSTHERIRKEAAKQHRTPVKAWSIAAACLLLVAGTLVLAPLWKSSDRLPTQSTDVPLSTSTSSTKPAGQSEAHNSSTTGQSETSPDGDSDKIVSAERVNLSAQQAYQNATYGAMLPTVFPDRFGFEEAWLYDEGQTDEMLCFVYTEGFGGYGHITIRLRGVSQIEPRRFVSADQPERYDITQYEIPFADTVPEELWGIIDSPGPVFQAQEITPELIACRVVETEDSGDEGISICFGVQFGDYVAEYSTKGVSAKEVYEIVVSTPLLGH